MKENSSSQVYTKLGNDDSFTQMFNKEVRSSVDLLVNCKNSLFIDKIADIRKFSKYKKSLRVIHYFDSLVY